MSTEFSMETTSIISGCHQCQCNFSNGILAGALSLTLVIIAILVLMVALFIGKVRKMK